MRRPLARRLPHALASLAIIAVLTFLYYSIVHVNTTTVALTFLLAILAVSAFWGMLVSAVMAVGAVLAFNFFFLPPIGALTISDPQNWVALLAFLTTAMAGSQLSARAHRQTQEARRQRREVERLYEFSQRLLIAGNAIELLNAIPRQIVDSFEVGAIAIFLADKHKVYRSGGSLPQLSLEELQEKTGRGDIHIDSQHSVCFVPIRMGVRILGCLGLSGRVLSRQSLEALGSLIAIAVERARAIEQLGKTEAAQEGERLKAALLDSVTHDFRTPLTSIKASVSSLLSPTPLDEAQRLELLTVIDEEANRLNVLVGEAAEMARLEAGDVVLELQPHPLAAIVAAALEQSRVALAARPIHVEIAPGLPMAVADLSRAKDALVQLLLNANAYSPAGHPITVRGEVNGDFGSISVSDQGAGIEEMELGLIFDKFYRGRDQRYVVQGTGMGLPIAKAIVEAQGGSLSVVSQPGRGSVFSFTLPLQSAESRAR